MPRYLEGWSRPIMFLYTRRVILHHYLLKAVLFRLFLALPALALVYLAFDLGDQGRRLAAESGWGPVLQGSLLHLPLVIVQILPAALMVSGVLALGDLRRRGELAAMAAAGMSPLRICTPLLSMGLLATLLALLVAELVVPRCERYADGLFGGSRTSPLTGPILPALWYRQGGWFIHLEGEEHFPHLVALHLDPLFHVLERVDGRVISLQEGRISGQRTTFGTPGRNTLHSGVFHLPALKAIGGLQHLSKTRAEALSYLALQNRLSQLAATGHARVPERLVLHTKLAFPLLNIVIFFWLCPFALNVKFISPIREILWTMGVILGLWTLIAAGWVMARVGLISPAAGVWLPVLTGLSLGVVQVARLFRVGRSRKGLLT